MKKNLISLAIASTLFSTNLLAADLTTVNQKASYTLGNDLAKNFESQGITIDVPALTAGMEDSLKKRPLQLTEEQMQTAIMDLKKQMMAKQAAEKKLLAEQNAKTGAEFMSKNKTQPGVKVLKNGLQYKIIRAGKGASPIEGDYITANYRGTLIDGTEFDSSYKRGTPIEFQMSNVIKGWGEALKRMKPGAKWEIYVPPALGYGEKGAGKAIGPNETLIFTIEFIKADKEKRVPN